MMLVLGATRPLGRSVVHDLAQAGVPHRVLLPSRQLLPGDELRAADVVIGAPEDSHVLDSAMDGISAVIMITPSHPHQVAHERQLLASCQRHRVQRIVKLSSTGAHADAPFRVGRWHWHTERLLSAMRADWTIVRAGRPMQYLTAQLPSLLSQHALYGCQGIGRSADVDQRDIARVLTAVALRGLHVHETIEVTGPAALSGSETAAQLGGAMGHPVAYVDCTSRDFVHSQMADGLPAWKAEDRAAWQREVRDGHYEFVSGIVETVTGQPARTLAAYANELAHNVRYAQSRRSALGGSARPTTPVGYAAPI